MKTLQLFTAALVAAASFAVGVRWERHQAQPAVMESRIMREADARKSTGRWGSIEIYTAEGAPTVGTESMLTAALEFLPGQQLQPPHRHVNEEFQYVIEGSGTWHLNGEDIPLRKGDLMYAKPGDLHGIRNSGTGPLRFFVVKWISKGGAAPKE